MVFIRGWILQAVFLQPQIGEKITQGYFGGNIILPVIGLIKNLSE